MKRRICLLLSLVLAIALLLAGCGESENYEKAMSLYKDGQYEEAAAIFTELGDYENSATMIENCQKKIEAEAMQAQYENVIDALDGNFWYFNGGSDTALNKITFSDCEATIAQVYFDGNGKQDNGSSKYDISIDDKKITVNLSDGSDIEIPYTVSGDEVTLDKSEYFTEADIEAGIQGYWKLRKTENIAGLYNSTSERNIYFNNGKVISESASAAHGGASGEYYYYGPYERTYSLDFGSFKMDTEAYEWFFNIIDGKVTILHYADVCSPASKLPGQYGYSF